MTTTKLTKSHVQSIFAPLSSPSPAVRSRFFVSVRDNVRWTIAGNGHALAGTRDSLAAHSAATFDRLGARLERPILFVVTRVLVDEEDRWACIEARGEATRKNGKPYNNEYVWMMHFDEEGLIDEVKSYFDTKLAEDVLFDSEPET